MALRLEAFIYKNIYLILVHKLLSVVFNLYCPVIGGLMSIFLMGVYDPDSRQWRTVAKCGNGHDDKTIEKLNRELPMKKISKVTGVLRFLFLVLIFVTVQLLC